MNEKDKIIASLRKQLNDANSKISALEQEVSLLTMSRDEEAEKLKGDIAWIIRRIRTFVKPENHKYLHLDYFSKKVKDIIDLDIEIPDEIMNTTTQRPLVIEKPSRELLDFVRSLEKKKEETRKELRAKKDMYFPIKKEIKRKENKQ